jgi:hypothetical protein
VGCIVRGVQAALALVVSKPLNLSMHPQTNPNMHAAHMRPGLTGRTPQHSEFRPCALPAVLCPWMRATHPPTAPPRSQPLLLRSRSRRLQQLPRESQHPWGPGHGQGVGLCSLMAACAADCHALHCKTWVYFGG